MIHVGYTLRGIPGALVTGLCFIVPTFLLTLALSAVYVSAGSVPQMNALLWGIKPVVVAIIAHVAYRLVQTALKSRALWVIFGLSIAAMVLVDVPEVLVMLGAGVVYAAWGKGMAGGVVGMVGLYLTPNPSPPVERGLNAARMTAIWQFAPIIAALLLQSGQAGLWDIFFYFLKIGSVMFGSGYVLIAYIQQDIVRSFGWLTQQQLLDAIAIGQVTPGPVSTAATVVGYIMAGVPGAVAATVGIFLPSFVLVILTAPLIPRMRRSRMMSDFLTGVNAGVVAAILVTLFDLAQAALRTPDSMAFSPIAIGLAVAALALLVRTKINATWLIVAGGVVGLLVG
jgi:chromate transporter